ncbi:SRPBCC family protein [Methylobacterium platani]|uniref:Polyketide cyclase n=2 Tax=Methylobacterium platani TaxID=427683 RepID=A0A179SC99_9HYPH|nr:hypothetical protein [Methylobacterium platani]KMO14023.1 hypothetical protein SQ03_20490 [Methylobacterium platani JCM 14648]OAS25489.1 hypothetical protein A5481_08995 [Methylobacterium platani]
MSDAACDEPCPGIEQAYDLGEPLEKVWRALSIPALREHWLPGSALAAPEPVAVTPGEEVSYRMREAAPPYLESTVTFHIAPNGTGGTCLRIVHDLTDARLAPPTTAAANGNMPMLRAA